MISCPYSGNCESEGIACGTCVHNPNRKEDHYQHERDYWKIKPWVKPWDEPYWYGESTNRHIPKSKTIVFDLCRIK